MGAEWRSVESGQGAEARVREEMVEAWPGSAGEEGDSVIF